MLSNVRHLTLVLQMHDQNLKKAKGITFIMLIKIHLFIITVMNSFDREYIMYNIIGCKS